MFYNKHITAEEYQATVEALEKRANDPNTPQGELKDINNRLCNARHNLKIAEREEYEQNNGVSVYGSDDYVVCSAGEYSFYFGYEATKCPIKSHKTDDDCYEKDCDRREWLFQASKGDTIVFEMLDSELSYPETDNIEKKLIVGMAHFIKNLPSNLK